MCSPKALYGRYSGSIKSICVCRRLAILPIIHFQQCGRAQLFVKTLMDQLREVSAYTHTQIDTALQGKHSQIDLLNSVLSRGTLCNCVITVRASAVSLCVCLHQSVSVDNFMKHCAFVFANSFQMKEALCV